MFTGQLKKFTRSSQQGFTLIELLIVVAILGLLAGICIPNVTQMMNTGTMNAANNELENVKTASVAYFARNNTWPADSSELSDLLSGTPKALYSFDIDTGYITDATDISWTGITWIKPLGPVFAQHGEWAR
jgi:prepilin-type N-terminal cleavage/methylation domain-containing protein